MNAPARLEFVLGDATFPVGDGPRVIAHVCNDIGAWGSGFVVGLSRRWSQPERNYRQWHAHEAPKSLPLGHVQAVYVGDGLCVANMIAQRGLRGRSNPVPIRYDALERCLAAVAEIALQGSASVHMPRIGCGRAGGRWSQVEPRIRSALCDRGIPVVVYDPANGAPAEGPRR